MVKYKCMLDIFKNETQGDIKWMDIPMTVTKMMNNHEQYWQCAQVHADIHASTHSHIRHANLPFPLPYL